MLKKMLFVLYCFKFDSDFRFIVVIILKLVIELLNKLFIGLRLYFIMY